MRSGGISQHTRNENTETSNNDFVAFGKKDIMTEYKYQNKIYILNLNTFYYLIKLLIVACSENMNEEVHISNDRMNRKLMNCIECIKFLFKGIKY